MSTTKADAVLAQLDRERFKRAVREAGVEKHDFPGARKAKYIRETDVPTVMSVLIGRAMGKQPGQESSGRY